MVAKKAVFKSSKFCSKDILSQSNTMTESDKRGDAHTATYGVLRFGPCVMDHEAHAPYATTAGTSTNATRSYHLGRRTCSITSGHIMKHKHIDRSGKDVFRFA